MSKRTKKQQEKIMLIIGVAVIMLAALGYGGYRFYLLYQDNLALGVRIGELEESLAQTQNSLSDSERERFLLAEGLQKEQDRLDSIRNTIQEVTDTVSDLEKLKKLDVELLQKYSKVYFLNEHYIPDSLRDIETEFLYNEDEPEQIHKKVRRFLENLLERAQKDDVELYIASAYRSFGTQAVLKSGYVFTYGVGSANSFSAEQGFSEHQLGTTVDFLTTGIGGKLLGFENTDAYDWLLQNAHRFGFVISYPQNNSYYRFEPWHWRFVGKDLADDLRDAEIGFYDMPQRVIDEYLIKIFD